MYGNQLLVAHGLLGESEWRRPVSVCLVNSAVDCLVSIYQFLVFRYENVALRI